MNAKAKSTSELLSDRRRDHVVHSADAEFERAAKLTVSVPTQGLRGARYAHLPLRELKTLTLSSNSWHYLTAR